jgi:hypothetical protein
MRALQRSYGSHERGAAGSIKCPRGQSPYRVERLLHNPNQQQDATRFARLCKHAGVIPPFHFAYVDRMLPGIERGEMRL